MSTTIIFDVQRSLKTVKKRGGKKARPDFERILHQAVGDEDLESFTPNAYIDTNAHYSIKWALEKAGWNVKPFPSMKRDLKRFPNAIIVTAESMPMLPRQNFRDKRIITTKGKRLRLAMSGNAEQ